MTVASAILYGFILSIFGTLLRILVGDNGSKRIRQQPLVVLLLLLFPVLGLVLVLALGVS
jgi:hypothetical protein